MVINQQKLELYANKLYRGELARYKEELEEDNIFSIDLFFEEEEKVRRIPVTKSQEKEILDKYKHKCVICNKPYDKDDFEIHHIDGDRSNTVMKNLIPLCHRCHKKVTRNAKAKLKDYQVRAERSEENTSGIPDIEILDVDIPRSEF